MRNLSFAIVIHTKERSWTFRNTIESISNFYSADESITIIVVDDSSCKTSKNTNQQILLGSSLKSILYIDSSRWQKFKQLLNCYFLKNERELSILKKIKLGESTWNTHNSRNIGKLLLGITKIAEFSLFLDDDMVLLKKLQLLRVSEQSQIPVWGIQLSGCPDLTRLEWIQLYLATHQNYLFPKEETDEILDSEYISRLVNELSVEVINTLISQFTDFTTTEKINTQDFPINNINLPQRHRISGGAYICRVADVGISSFPKWYNEDWNWFDLITKKYRSNPIFLEDYIVHNADKKNILNPNLMLFEEYGKVCLKLSKCLALNSKIEEKDYYSSVQERVNELRYILNQANLLGKRLSIYSYKFQEICDSVSLVMNNLMNQDNTIYENAISDFVEDNLVWQSITTKLDSLTRVGQDRQWQLFLENALSTLKI